MKKKLFSIMLIGLLPCLLLSWCKKAPDIAVEKRDKVTLTYDSYLQDWQVLEQDVNKTIVIWLKDSFPAFDKELLWMKVWENKVFTTNKPSDWYGIFYDELKIQEISSTIVNSIWTTPKVWDQINLWWLKWVILEVYPTTVRIDFNDRQTRENVEFHVTVLDIERETAE